MKRIALCFLVGCASHGASFGDDAPGNPRVEAGADATPSGSSEDGSSPPPMICGMKGQPLQAQNDRWSWVDVPGSQCGNGSQTGFAIYPTAQSKTLLVYLMGGGGCFDQASCGGWDQNHQAAHLNGYDAQTFQQEMSQLFGSGSVMDRGAQGNPFADASVVFVPYCTGDFHSGSNVASYGTHHMGFANMALYLKYLAPTFCSRVDRVILAGSSAGGAGAVFNYEPVKDAFSGIPVDLVDDSFPLMSPQVMTLQSQMRTAWGSAKNAPAGCASCSSDWSAYFPYYASTYPSRRFSLLQSTHDYSICPYFGLYAPDQCKQAVTALYSGSLKNLASTRAWLSDDFHHVWMAPGFTQATSMNVRVADFVRQQITMNPQWSSVVPP